MPGSFRAAVLENGEDVVRKPLILLAAFAALAVPAVAAEDPIDARQALMRNNGAAAGAGGGIMKGEIDYSTPVGRAVIYAFGATAETFGDYFPEGSLDPERSRAAPAIWEDMAGFQAKLAEFQDAVAAAREAAGDEGPADAQAFQAAVGPVLETCRGCHETYRTEEQ
jgi:cytochrome c556